jgi:hypothetical protein
LKKLKYKKANTKTVLAFLITLLTLELSHKRAFQTFKFMRYLLHILSNFLVEYFGVKFSHEFVVATILDKETYGVIDNWERRFPLLRGQEFF